MALAIPETHDETHCGCRQRAMFAFAATLGGQGMARRVEPALAGVDSLISAEFASKIHLSDPPPR